jgi:hypothetical protein
MVCWPSGRGRVRTFQIGSQVGLASLKKAQSASILHSLSNYPYRLIFSLFLSDIIINSDINTRSDLSRGISPRFAPSKRVDPTLAS